MECQRPALSSRTLLITLKDLEWDAIVQTTLCDSQAYDTGSCNQNFELFVVFGRSCKIVLSLGEVGSHGENECLSD